MSGTRNINNQLIIQERTEELKRIKSSYPTMPATNIDFNPNSVQEATTMRYIVVPKDSFQPLVGSYGAGSCLIVALHDPTTFTVLTHLIRGTNPHFLSTFLDQMNPATTVAHLAGGNFSLELMTSGSSCVIDTFRFLTARGIKIETCNVAWEIERYTRGRAEEESASLAINATTGKVYAPVASKYFYSSPNEKHIDDVLLDKSFITRQSAALPSAVDETKLSPPPSASIEPSSPPPPAAVRTNEPEEAESNKFKPF